MTEIARVVRGSSQDFEVRVKGLYDDIKRVFAMYDREVVSISGLSEKIEEAGGYLKDIGEKVSRFSEDLGGIKFVEKGVVQRIVDGVNGLGVSLNRLSVDKRRVEGVLDACKSGITEVQKIVESNIETIKTIKKLVPLSRT